MSNNKDFVVAGAVEVGKDTKVTLGSITSSDIDLATGNYFADTLAADTTYTISNAGDVQAFQLEVTGGASSTWDISTASYNQSFSVFTQDDSPSDVFFKPDGTKMYVSGNAENSVYEYDLSTPWDVSAASYNQSFSVTTQESDPRGLFFKPDGAKMYIVGADGDEVNEYDLSTAWDVSTASFLQLFSVSTQDTSPQGITFKPDGTKMYIMGFTSDNVNEYTLSTAWDVSTASYFQNFNVSSQETGPQGIFFKPDGTKLYVTGSIGDDINEYNIGTDATLTWPSSIEWAGGIAPSAPATGETDVYTLVTDDGGTSYVGVKSADNLS